MTSTLNRSPGSGGTTVDRRTVRVIARTMIADGVVLLDLGCADGGPLPSWEPGAHLELLLDNGLIRQYSLCGDPTDVSSYRIGVLDEPDGRGGSRYVHERLALGDLLTVAGPRNHFLLIDAERYVFVAGGIGITPMLPMIRSAEQAGRPWTLAYGGRRQASRAFAQELAAHGTRVTLWPQDEKGLIDLPAVLSEPRAGTAVYACGPEPLLRAVEDICAARWPIGALHVERFAPKVVEGRWDTAFEVELAQTGRTLTVPADRSVLEVLQDAGVDVYTSCGEGTCGTCETEVLEGEPDHRDSVLTPEEQAEGGCMMVCVSRSSGPRLVLDL